MIFTLNDGKRPNFQACEEMLTREILAVGARLVGMLLSRLYVHVAWQDSGVTSD